MTVFIELLQAVFWLRNNVKMAETLETACECQDKVTAPNLEKNAPSDDVANELEPPTGVGLEEHPGDKSWSYVWHADSNLIFMATSCNDSVATSIRCETLLAR